MAMKLSILSTLFLLLAVCPFSNAVCSCAQEKLPVAIKTSKEVVKVKTTYVKHTAAGTQVGLEILEVYKPCKISFKSIVINAKAGQCGAKLMPNTVYVFAGDLSLFTGSKPVTIITCNYAKEIKAVTAVELKVLAALKKPCLK